MTDRQQTSTGTVHQPGIIEGFFGRSWSWPERRKMADFLAVNGYDFYVYAPKSDPWLRRQWQTPWPVEQAGELHGLREHCNNSRLKFGVGLTPFDIYQASVSSNLKHLRNKVAELNELSPDILCILFDDMRGDWPQLAEQQIRWVHTIAELSNAGQFIFCPTYYSTDPVLEKVFGTRPEHYWEDLGHHIDRSIDFFWTGPKVCSDRYPAESLRDIANRFQRKPFLWDNYPVNDGAIKSGFLHLDAFPAEYAALGSLTAGHCANPMNQPMLSRLALRSLPAALQADSNYTPKATFAEACQQLYPDIFATALMEDAASFQQKGLKGLGEAEKNTLYDKYKRLAETFPEQGAEEICDWLRDEYAFDPACLTD